MKYFGLERFRKPEEEQIPTPIGEPCLLCMEAIVDGDMGTYDNGQAIHYECGLRAAAGSVGHQLGKCSCYGGTEEDPPGMTRREAAIAAARLYDETHSY